MSNEEIKKYITNLPVVKRYKNIYEQIVNVYDIDFGIFAVSISCLKENPVSSIVEMWEKYPGLSRKDWNFLNMLQDDRFNSQPWVKRWDWHNLDNVESPWDEVCTIVKHVERIVALKAFL